MERITRTIARTEALIKVVDLAEKDVKELTFYFYRDFKKNSSLLSKVAEKELKKYGYIFLELLDFHTLYHKYSMSIKDFVAHATQEEFEG